MKILIAMDDSPHARAAADWVRRMTWTAGTEVLVVCAARPVLFGYNLVDAAGHSVVQGFEQEQVRACEEFTARVERELLDAGLTARSHVAPGDPRFVILETARAEKVDLIVLGSHGRSGLTKLLVGSVASHVLTHATCNVLVVKLPQP